MKRLVALALAALTLLAGWTAAAAARLTSPVGKQMLYYSISADQTGANVKVQGIVGPLYLSADGYDLRHGATRIPMSGRLGNLVPVLPYENGLTQKQVQSRATAFFNQYYPIIRDSLTPWMKANGVSQAWIRYKQTVNVKSSTGTDQMAIQWSALLDDSGRGVRPDPKVVMDRGLKILQVRYIPLSTASEVPASLAYTDAGMLYWRVVNEQFVPLTAWSSMQTNGAFDEPTDYGDGTPIDPDGRVKCLMDKRKTGPAWQPHSSIDDSVTCDQAMPDVISMMADTNAQLAVVDYVRRVEPIWCREDDAPCLAGTAEPNPDLPYNPGAQYIPSIAYRFDLRTLGGNACAAQEFRNHGWSGYKLDLTVDRYLAFSTGMYQHANQFRGAWISGPQEFDHLVTLPSGILQDAVSMAGKVINPQDPSAIISVADVPNLLELAPVTALANLDETYDVLAQKTCRDFSGLFAVSITLRCHPGGQIGVSAVSHFWMVSGAVTATSQEVLFPRGTPGSGYLPLIPNPGWEGWTMTWSYDGSNTLTLPDLFDIDNSTYSDEYGFYTSYTPCSIPFN
jgi:hypothetical protein